MKILLYVKDTGWLTATGSTTQIHTNAEAFTSMEEAHYAARYHEVQYYELFILVK